MDNFLKGKIPKIFFMYVMPLIIGGVFSALGNWNDPNDNYFIIKVVILLLLLGCYIYTSYKYNSFEKDLNEMLDKKKKEIEKLNIKSINDEKIKDSFSKETRALSTLCLDSAKSINELANNVLDGKRTLDTWNFSKVSTGICNSIYDVLCSICAPCDEFTVNILLDDITASGAKKRNFTMIAHKGKFEDYPSKFQEKMYYKDHKDFYATKLFQKGKSDIKILISKEEVNEKFVYCDEDHPEYSQYVGIPIICSGSKMICLLQICSFNNSKIGNDKIEILNIVKTYILPFVQFALLNYKVEKGFLSSFSVLGKMEENSNG